MTNWIDGETADLHPLQPSESPRLADILRRLHSPAPREAPLNPYRGVALSARAASVQQRLKQIAVHDPTAALVLGEAWGSAVTEAPSNDQRWIHGDLHPGNVVVRDRRLAGLIDWGDLAAGDVATDLACAWLLFESEDARGEFLDVYGADTHLRSRARGWAVLFATAFIESADPRYIATASAVVRRLGREKMLGAG